MANSNPINKNESRKEIRFKDVVDFITIILFGTMIFGNFLKRDVVTQEYVAYYTTRIIHILAFSTIPIGLITCVLVRQFTTQEVSDSIQSVGLIFAAYVTGLTTLFIGVLLPHIINWREIQIYTKERGIFLCYIMQAFWFIVPVLFASLVIGRGGSIIAVIPLYLLSGIAIGVNFPTLKRWKKRTNWTSLLD